MEEAFYFSMNTMSPLYHNVVLLFLKGFLIPTQNRNDKIIITFSIIFFLESFTVIIYILGVLESAVSYSFPCFVFRIECSNK
jgi:hypothetical protein